MDFVVALIAEQAGFFAQLAGPLAWTDIHADIAQTSYA